MTGLREKNASTNGGATIWSGGAIDTDKGIVYLPCGNPAPDFDASSRPGENLYSNNVIAVNISTGKILWATPFIAAGTVLNVTIPDTHDWDTCWGTNLVTINSSKGPEKIVIGHNKRGDIMAMNSTTGNANLVGKCSFSLSHKRSSDAKWQRSGLAQSKRRSHGIFSL